MLGLNYNLNIKLINRNVAINTKININNDKIYIIALLLYCLLNYDLLFEILFNSMNGDLSTWAVQKSIERYDEIADVSITQQISTVVFIFYCTLMGYSKKNYVNTIILIIMIAVESSNLARASVVIGLASIFSGYLISENNELQTIKHKKIIIYFMFTILILILIFSFSAILRLTQYNDIDLTDIFTSKIQSYTVAIYDAFALWVYNAPIFPVSYGFESFTFVFKAFGYKAPPGFYDPINTNYGETNVFSLLRGFLNDFGVCLTIIIFLLFGVIINWCNYIKLTLIKFIILNSIIFILVTVVISPFQFTTVSAGFFCGLVYVYFNQSKNQSHLS